MADRRRPEAPDAPAAGNADHARDALDGHVPAQSPLSPRTAFDGLSKLVRPLVRYAPEDPWELDTRTLPRALGRHRRKLRAFAERHLAPAAHACDVEPHRPVGQASPRAHAVLVAAAREGLLADMLPAPFGAADPRLFAHPLQLVSALKTEELAAVDGGLMLLICAHALGVAPVVLSGDLGAIRRYLLPAYRASLAGDPQLFAFAITEPAAGSDVEEGHGAARLAPGTVARAVEGGHRLSGRKCYISGGDLAREIAVFAALEGEGIESWTAFLVNTRSPGVSVVRTERKMGMRASGTAELAFDDVFVPHERVLGGLRKGWAINRATLNMSRLPVAAMGVGFARAALETATAFACSQRLGGKPLVHYQEVQLALADMLAETQAARAMVWAAASRTQAIQREASAAKVFCTDVGLRVCGRAMDLLGNHALLHGARVERAWRDARLTQIFEGTNQINRLAMIEDVQEQLLATIARLAHVEAEGA
jgi:alkylation response protein AidB-like acyl-CoA dehydrogenase